MSGWWKLMCSCQACSPIPPVGAYTRTSPRFIDDLDVLHGNDDVLEARCDAEALQGAHRLAVEVDGARGRPHLGILLEPDRRETGPTAQRKSSGSNWTSTNHDHIDVDIHKHSFVSKTVRIE